MARAAEAIISGQLYLSEAIARAGVTRIDEVPIVDGLTATLKMAEIMADMKKLGFGVTRRGDTHGRPSKDMIEHARRLHGRTLPSIALHNTQCAASRYHRPAALRVVAVISAALQSQTLRRDASSTPLLSMRHWTLQAAFALKLRLR